MSDTTSTTRSPHDIIGVATAFWTSKVVLSAVELGVFTRLSERSGSLEQLCADLSIRGRGARDFFDILVSLELLERDEGSYRNSELADAYLNPALPAYDISGYLRNLNAVFASRSLLTETLRSGGRLNYAKALAAAGADETAAGAVLMPADADADTFGEAFAAPNQVRGFVRAMTGYSMGAHRSLVSAFDWSGVGNVVDVGCSEGAFLAHMLRAHPHLAGIGFDLAQVTDHFGTFTRTMGIQDRVRFVSGDFLSGPLPSGDVIVMGHVLHDWNLQIKRMLVGKAYEALPPGGSLLVYESLIDDERRVNTAGMIMSLNVSLVSAGGLGYTGAECREWMADAGFQDLSVTHLEGPEYMVVGRKRRLDT